MSYINYKLVLLILAFLPLLTVFVLIFISADNFAYIRNIALVSTVLSFIAGGILLMKFNLNTAYFQFLVPLKYFNLINVQYTLGLDALSIWFVFLNCLLSFLSIFYISKNTISAKFFIILLLLIQFFVVQSFLVTDFFMFYIFFEAILIPMFMLIGVWGSYDRNLHAAFLFFLYTLAGSLIMLLSLQYIQSELGSTNFYFMYENRLTYFGQAIIFISFFIAFAVKVPMFPLHVWLPEAHGEAPTIGSMILAGILLKLGLYGFARILIPVCSDVLNIFIPIICLFGLLGVTYTALATLVQTDIKRVIAYSSVGHMSLAVLGLFSNTVVGFEGSLFSIISHGFISPALFMGVGLLYDRYGTKLINYYGNLVTFMPLLAVFMFFMSLANLAFPGTSAFVGEFLIFSGLIANNFILFFIASTSVVFVAFYTFWLFNRIFFGPNTLNTIKYADLNLEEFLSFLLLSIFVIILGLFPSIVLDTLHVYSLNLLNINAS
jgi:NADH-quinone oxidoreductase subunit M